MRAKIERGDLVADKITGFTGVVVCLVRWAFSETRAGLRSRALDDSGKPKDIQWFDVSSCVLREKAVVPVQPLIKHSLQMLDFVEDSVTGFEGKIVCFDHWITGCVRAGVQPTGFTRDGIPVEAQTFSVEQLERLAGAEKELKSTGGGPMPGARRPRDPAY